jgi:hypothetical protein
LLAPSVVLLCAALLAWVQFSFDGLDDSDSYFHTRAARELDRHGVRTEFPQTAYSTWSDRYSDKDLLFHLFLIPFQRLHQARQGGTGTEREVEDLVTPGKQAVAVLAFVFFATLALSLSWTGARFRWFWLILFFTADVNLLNALLSVRPGLLGVVFVTLEIALVIKRRGVWLAVVGALHTLSHSSFVLLPALALAALVAHRLRREPFPLRLLVFSLVGPTLASLLHPYFPNNLYLAWDQLVEVARNVWWPGAEIPRYLFGPELFATKTDAFLGTYPALLPAAGGIIAFLAYPRPRLSTDGLALLFMSGLLLVGGFLSQRFLEFFFPCAALLGARLWTDRLGRKTLREARRRNAPAFFLAIGLLVFCPVAGLTRGSVLTLRAHVQSKTPVEVQRPAVDFLKRAARPEELVYHNFWWDFSVLYHYRPRGRYVVALDPVFFYRHDAELFKKSLDAYLGQSDDLYRVLEQDFGARWVYMRKSPRLYPFFNLVRADKRFEKAYEDSHVVIVRLP